MPKIDFTKIQIKSSSTQPTFSKSLEQEKKPTIKTKTVLKTKK